MRPSLEHELVRLAVEDGPREEHEADEGLHLCHTKTRTAVWHRGPAVHRLGNVGGVLHGHSALCVAEVPHRKLHGDAWIDECTLCVAEPPEV